MHNRSLVWVLAGLVCVLQVHAAVTVYSQIPFGDSTKTATASAANETANAYYDSTQLTAPALPDDLPATSFTLQLGATNTSQGGLSIAIPGTFYGFSVEMSVANEISLITHKSGQELVPFLNLMSLLKARSGGVHIRVGGNSQETATMVSYSLPNGTFLEKSAVVAADTTQTPALLFDPDLIYTMGNISALIDGVKWYLGVPMNDTSNLRLAIAEYGETILGNNLLGLQVGNEPDLYGRDQFGGRPTTYSPQNYFTDFGLVMTGINNDANIPVKSNIVGPSTTGDEWSPEDIFNTGYLTAYGSNLGFISVEKYPDDNCFAIFGGNSQPKYPQTEFPNYLKHSAGASIISGFLNASTIAQSLGKPMIMFETNTASCGGFPGLSDSYGSALWGLDYGLTMASSNFSEALLHVSGANDAYDRSPIFFSTLIMAEALGPTNTAQVVDLQANSASDMTPAYGIYEKGVPARVALFNYMTDPTGANTYTASIAVDSGTLSSVQVKYLSAPSVAEKYNITWAGQDFGLAFQADGRLQGNVTVQTIQCSNNVCKVQVPAPGFALVFLTDNAFNEVNPAPSAIPTFSTTTLSGKATATIDPSVLATSNGHGGPGGKINLGSTSNESNGNGRAVGLSWMSVFVAVVFGAAATVGQRTL
ncbi:hypothetical protein HWV62_3829 [Athelia sp. TMB]|nr:hypothetical protein HWV62_3829 [Athelia sp. TMB]